MRPGAPAVCFGTVVHRRLTPAGHRFTYPVNQIWIDPDHPEALFGRHPLWSASRPAPIRFRRTDYLDGTNRPLGPAVRRVLADALDRAPTGPLRMLTQPRTWGWLFNPITIYLAWDAGATGTTDRAPMAALLEVTNTPWKERHLYPVALHPVASEPAADRPAIHRATFDKALHVSPFLDEDHRYVLDVSATDAGRDAARPRRLTVGLDVFEPHHRSTPEQVGRIRSGVPLEERNDPDLDEDLPGRLVLTTSLVVDQYPVERSVLTQALHRNPLPTHRVSAGIHRQAVSLWRKRVPFVSHPKRSPTAPTSPPSSRP